VFVSVSHFHLGIMFLGNAWNLPFIKGLVSAAVLNDDFTDIFIYSEFYNKIMGLGKSM
jgi:hypothetical protein